MKDHFLKKDSLDNRIRYSIYLLMVRFEEMHDLMDQLLSFQIGEEKAKDSIEECLIEMEKIHLELTKDLKKKESAHNAGEQSQFETTLVYEAIRRTYNFLGGLNAINLDSPKWVHVTTKCVVDKSYYRQVKSLVYSNPKK